MATISGVSSPTIPSNRTRDWSSLKPGEPGSAFRGLSRGRGVRAGPRGNSKGGRGGGGGGGGRAASGPSTLRGGKISGESTETSASKVDAAPSTNHSPNPSKLLSTKEKVTSVEEKLSSGGGSEPPPRGKLPRRGSRSVPSITTDPISPIIERAPQSASSRSSNRRRRSQHQGKGTSNTQTNTSLSTKTSQASLQPGPHKSKTVPPSPVVSTRRDMPPHLIATHDAEIRHDIESFVEHVRAVAMAENRPTSPGSHIDWAGDDDDSLPDLDDWGLAMTSTSTVEKNEEISPILVDALKPLPEPIAVVLEQPESGNEQSHGKKPDCPRPPNLDPPVQIPAEGQEVALTTPKIIKQDSTEAQSISQDALPSAELDSQTKLPIHPSLPAKPVIATDKWGDQPRTRNDVAKARANLPPKPITIAPEGPSMEELLRSSFVPSTQKADFSSEVEHGLSASIHAPKGIPESHSAPRLSANHAYSNSQPSNPAYARARRVDRPRSFQPPASAPSHILSERSSRSGATSPYGGGHGPIHARNHSTPPAGAGFTSRAPQSTRPVLTVDALSTLVRTMGIRQRPPTVSSGHE